MKPFKSFLMTENKALIKESATVIVAFTIHSKSGVKHDIKAGTKKRVSSKQDLAKQLNITTKGHLFADDADEKLFDQILAKGGTAYMYVDPWNADINGIISFGVARSQKEADDRYGDSADSV